MSPDLMKYMDKCPLCMNTFSNGTMLIFIGASIPIIMIIAYYMYCVIGKKFRYLSSGLEEELKNTNKKNDEKLSELV